MSEQQMRKITFEADFDRPIDLQTIQEADAKWNGQAIEVTFNISIEGNLELMRTSITVNQARLFAQRLQTAIQEATT